MKYEPTVKGGERNAKWKNEKKGKSIEKRNGLANGGYCRRLSINTSNSISEAPSRKKQTNEE